MTDEEAAGGRAGGSNHGSLHDDVATWHDVCCCEPEPRWQAIAAEGSSCDAPRAQAGPGDGARPGAGGPASPDPAGRARDRGAGAGGADVTPGESRPA